MFTQTIMMHHIVNNLWLGSQDDADKLVRNNATFPLTLPSHS